MLYRNPINRCALLNVQLCNFFNLFNAFSQSVVLWQGRGGIQKIALFGERPSLYYGKNSSKMQSAMTVHHYFKTWRSVNPEHFKNFDNFFKCRRKNHQALWWNWLSWGPQQKWKTQSCLCWRGFFKFHFQFDFRMSSLELVASEIAAQINASQNSSNRHISTSTV